MLFLYLSIFRKNSIFVVNMKNFRTESPIYFSPMASVASPWARELRNERRAESPS